MVMTLYERIRKLRIEAGMSQDELAKRMGYKDRSMITKIESGKVDISQKKIISFAEALKTTPGYLMGWDETEERIIPIVVPDNERFVELVKYMPNDEYIMVMDAFSRAEKRLKEKEEKEKANDSLQTETGF